MSNDTQTGTGFLNRKITMKWALLLVELALLLGLVLWALKSFELGRFAGNANWALGVQTNQTAQVTARSIATFGNGQIVAKDWGALQTAADELVAQGPLAYVVIADQKGIAVVHTNRGLLGKKLSNALPLTVRVSEASIPAMSATSQVATIRVGVNLPPEIEDERARRSLTQ